MNEQRPPDATDLRKEFKKAHDDERDKETKPPEQTVTKAEIEWLKDQRAKPSQELHFTPDGSKPAKAPDPELEKRIAKLTERLNATKGKAREDFGRSL